ncbi:sensor histidine kinase [Amycolatopsis acidiphila]|uniref:histidine kinase n=1 Tax=Amycolatopsis acidiphila TaxID=715473 RepID=A0A558AIX9_9PSEU|nr:sensor histidine kinase [Amycolatopsis acidiphila]TVT24223.1 sensor histidine kinase [Amycolatopsis acidiphila]UIJ62649.1 sensor histidine kinase [Amycolatopsis acidiphila]GHG85950.1 histidine kinase [Amycolatopsis acidiphila]
MWRSRPLASQILLAVLGILLASVSAGALLYGKLTGQTLDTQYGQRALGIATTVAQMPMIREALLRDDPDHSIQAMAEQVRRSTDAAYVVVTDRSGLRYSHPNSLLIGQRIEEPVAALDGRGHLGIDNGSLGRSANGRAPLFGSDGTVVGQVSVGILEEQVSSELANEILWVILYSAAALALGVGASWLLAHRIKKATFGLEVSEIVSLLQEREAMLHGIREGVLGVDTDGRVEVINDEARRLLGISTTARGRQLGELLPPGRLHDLLGGPGDCRDEVVLTDEFLLVVNRMPVILSGRDVGSVITLRDRTEMEGLVRELHAVTGLTTALRAQEHEFNNRLHVLSGLLGLGEPDEAARYLAEISHDSTAQAGDLRARISPPELAALLLAKVTIAAERGVRLTVSPDSHLDLPPVATSSLLSVLGNLIDNAVEAVSGGPEPRVVGVQLSDAGTELRMVVTDTGPGIPDEALRQIFVDGYSTKSARGGMRRGLGLALVHRLVHQAGGSIKVAPGPGACFDVRIPTAGPSAPAERSELEQVR